MTGDYKSRFIPGILSIMFTLLLLSGCIAENTDDCFKGIPLNVKLPAGVSQETIKDMNLYVFDDNDLLLGIFPVNDEEPVFLDYPGITDIHCVAWGNTQDGTMFVSPLKKGDPLSDGFISLKPSVLTRAEEGIFVSPTDLFYGEFNVDNAPTTSQVEEQNMSVSRVTASMTITMRGLQKLTGSEGGDYSLVIRETGSRINFDGRYGGKPAAYSPAMNLTENRDYVVPPFLLFPSSSNRGLTIDIYRNRSLIESVAADGGGNPILPIVDKTLNLFLNFEGSVNVEIEITGWGEKYVWKEYN